MKRAGRPTLRAGEASNSVHVKLPESLHDKACRVAIRNGESVSAVLRRGLSLLVRSEPNNVATK